MGRVLANPLSQNTLSMPVSFARPGQVTSHVRLDDVDFGEMMPFPDAQRAIVSREKICDYLLNTTHPVGAAKAVWFASLGDTLEDWQHLAADLLAVATDCEEFLAKNPRHMA